MTSPNGLKDSNTRVCKGLDLVFMFYFWGSFFCAMAFFCKGLPHIPLLLTQANPMEIAEIAGNAQVLHVKAVVWVTSSVCWAHLPFYLTVIM